LINSCPNGGILFQHYTEDIATMYGRASAAVLYLATSEMHSPVLLISSFLSGTRRCAHDNASFMTSATIFLVAYRVSYQYGLRPGRRDLTYIPQSPVALSVEELFGLVVSVSNPAN
jgi:hypothetical protein